MRAFRLTRVFAVFLALVFVADSAAILAQDRGRGRGRERGRGQQAQQQRQQPAQQDRGNARRAQMQQARQQRQQQAQPQRVQQNRGNDRRVQMQQQRQEQQQRAVQNRGNDRRVQMQQQRQAQQQRAVQNRGNDRRVEMQQAQQQRMQQIHQRRQQQGQQRVQPNRGNDRRAQMQQMQQQRMQQMQQRRQQQAQQRVQPNRGGDRRAQMQQVQQQRQHQAQQRVLQNRGNDRRVRMQQQRMHQIQQQRVFQNRGSDRRGQIQQRIQQMQQQSPTWAGRGRGDDRRSILRNRQNARQPQIVPQPKRSWFPQFAEQRRGRDGDRRIRDRSALQVQRNRNIFVQRQPTWVGGSLPSSYSWPRRGEGNRVRGSWADDGRRYQGARWPGERRRERGNRSWAYSAPTVFWQQTYTPTYRPRTFFDSYVYAMGRSYPSSYSGDYANTSRYANYGGYSNYDYSDPYYAYDDYDRPSATDIFRNVIFAVLGGGVPVYDDPSYVSGYASDNYAPYSPQYAGYSSGAYYSADYSYATDPAYYDPHFYEDPHYSEVLPIQYFVEDVPGGGLFRQMFTQLLAIGYDQGYQDGVAALSIRERDRVFHDPYTYDNAAFDPYSVSLGDNRRCLSQGYELGYQDAIDEIDGYDQFQDGQVDLVSVLIGTVSQLI